MRCIDFFPTTAGEMPIDPFWDASTDRPLMRLRHWQTIVKFMKEPELRGGGRRGGGAQREREQLL